MRTLFIYFNRYVRPRTLLSMSLLETILKKEGHETKIFDTSFYRSVLDASEANMIDSGIHQKTRGSLDIKLKESDPYEDFKATIKEFDPQLVAFSFYSVNSDIHRRLLIPMRNEFPDIKVICGGPTPSINPISCFDEGYVDMVCCGEGEKVLTEVCNRIENGKGTSGIKGLWIKQDDKIVNNGIADLTDLSTLPIQDWDSYDPIQIHGMFEGRAYRMGHVEFTRGCPYDCSYCGSGSIKQTYINAGCKIYVRHKDPKQFVQECKALRDKYNLEIFYFVDGTFTSMSKKVLRELSELYRKEVGVPFIALVHPLTINKETAQLLGNMGCIHVSIGVESGDAEYRHKVLNRKMTNKRIIEAITYLRDSGVHVSAYNMIGIPGMDREHVFKTIKLNKDAKPNSSIVSIFIPFADAELTKNLIISGLLKKENIKITTGLYPTVEIEDMTHDEINSLFNTFNLYIKLPKFTYPLIRLLERDNFLTVFIRKILYRMIDLERQYHLSVLRRKI